MDLDLWLRRGGINWSNRKSKESVHVVNAYYHILHCQPHFSWPSWHLLSVSLNFIFRGASTHSWSPPALSSLRPAFLKYSCCVDAETHPSHDQADRQTGSEHFLLSFHRPSLSLRRKKQIVCFAETFFILHWRKRPLIFFLPYILYADNAGIAHRWKEIVHYCRPGRWHMKLSSCACFE